MTIFWNRSKEGYCTSKCGRFEIEPVFIGRTTPQAFNLYYRQTRFDSREKVAYYADTQRDAKEAAERHAQKVVDDFRSQQNKLYAERGI
jgi:hypothetical protein